MRRFKNFFSKNILLKNALIVSLGGLIVKISGAFYRIPLNNLLKAEGLGIYQTAFPVYLILMTFSGTAATTTIAKAISAGENGRRVLSKSLAVVLSVGVIGWLFMSVFSERLSEIQGNEKAKSAYIALAPSLVFVAAISCLRGYFQGKNDMRPTAVSQIIEQFVKIIVGLSLCFFFGTSPETGAFWACFAVTAGEFSAAVYLFFAYKKSEEKQFDDAAKYPFKRLIATLIPIALTSSIIPFSRLFDSFTVINSISRYSEKATELYGLYSGSAESLIGMPVAVCYGLAVATVPAISSYIAKNDFQSAKKCTVKALAYTLLFSTAAFLTVAFGSKLIVRLLFSKLSDENKIILTALLTYSSINIVLLSTIQTQSSILISNEKTFASAISLLVGFALKAVMQIFLLKNPDYNIFAVLYSDILCYFVAVFLNLVYIICIYKKRTATNETCTCGSGRESGRSLLKSLGRNKESG